MKIDVANTNTAILEELGLRLTRVRLSHNLKQSELARIAGVSKSTVERLETGRSVQLANFIRVLGGLGVTQNLENLLPDLDPSPIAQLKHRQKQRQRDSTTRNNPPVSGHWTWGDEK
jgi:transcriptional regulator with XRE-family HTH domain